MVTKSPILVVVTYMLMLFQLPHSPHPTPPIFQPKYDMIFFYAPKEGVGWRQGDVVFFCFEFVM
jgi:hypothetical protein